MHVLARLNVFIDFFIKYSATAERKISGYIACDFTIGQRGAFDLKRRYPLSLQTLTLPNLFKKYI